ncbi:MAG: glycosyltransferase family A protein [Cyclobacteriaceae bacterium]
MTKPFQISVLIATYNTAFPLIKRAIKSVLAQSYSYFEIIIIDDGSNNDSHNQLLAFCRKHEDKILYLRQKNSGQSEAINRGVLLSKGDFIAILDADDEYLPQHLENCLASMSNYDLIASTTTTIVNSAADHWVPDRYNPSQLIHVDNCILFATLFGRKEVFNSLKFKKGYGADADFYDAAKKKFKAGKLNLKTYVYYRNHKNSTCDLMKRSVNQ